MDTQSLRHAIQILLLTLCSITTHAGTLAFNYDLAGRLTTATFASSKSIAYTYDPAGNLLQRQISVGSNPDTDGDGMDDAWEILYFGSKETRDGTFDFDNDGFLDLNEFLAGTLPNDANSALRVLSNPTVGGSSATIQWASVSGKQYRLQYKNLLTDTNWTDVPGDVTASGATSSKADNTITGITARYYRVRLLP